MTSAAHATVKPLRPRSIALVDLSYMFKKRYHTTPAGERNAAAKLTLMDLDRLRRGVEHVIICRDWPPYKLKEVYPDYKSNRPEMEPEEIAQRKFLYEAIKREGFNLAQVKGQEADAVMATLARIYGEWCGDVRIVGPDKDMAQCVTDSVIQFIPPHGERDWQIRNAKAVEEKFGVEPSRMPLWQALVGDTSDNIPGVKGVGPVIATKLVSKYGSLQRLAEAMSAEAASGRPSVACKAILANWPLLVTCLKLTTLDTNVAIDSEALLMARARQEDPTFHNDMAADVELDGFERNSTPLPPQSEEDVEEDLDLEPEPEAPVAELAQLWERASKVYDARFVSNNDNATPAPAPAPPAPVAAKDGELLEAEYDRERSAEGEADPVSNTPGDKGAEPVKPPPRRAVSTTALVRQPTATRHDKYGLVTADLQPLDLTSAYHISEWVVKSELYKQFKTASQVFVTIARGKELGIGMMTMLAGTHMIDGKPTLSADMIRSLAERDKNYEYMYPVEMSATRVVWIGKNKKHPEPVRYSYTIEEAQQAGLAGKGNYGNQSNWTKRPQDMLMKTAGSKLARLLWPGATLGFYCPEEMGFTEEELTAEAA